MSSPRIARPSPVGRGGDPIGVGEVGGGLDDRARRALGILGLENPRANEVALGAELHRQRRIGGGCDATSAEERHWEPARAGDLLDDVDRGAQILGGGRQLLGARASRGA